MVKKQDSKLKNKNDIAYTILYKIVFEKMNRDLTHLHHYQYSSNIVRVFNPLYMKSRYDIPSLILSHFDHWLSQII